MISIRVHWIGKEKLIAACDFELLGKKFREEKKILWVTEDFYGRGYQGNEKNLTDELSQSTMANLVGEITVNAAVVAGFIDRNNILKVEGVPHAQYLLIKE
jgi:hypothetical protein